MSGLVSHLSADDEMAELLPHCRPAVRAVVMRGNRLLVQKKVYASGEIRFVLPGGGPEVGETLEDGLRRECLEEIGAEIEIQQLMHVADYYKKRESDPLTLRHQIEFLFRCRVPSDYLAVNGTKPDKHQTDVLWIGLHSESVELLHPKQFREVLTADHNIPPVYLGVIG